MRGVLASLFHDETRVAKIFHELRKAESGDTWMVEMLMNLKIMNFGGTLSPFILKCESIHEEERVIVFPYCHQIDIIHYMERNRCSEELLLKWVDQMIDAVYCLHEHLEIAHMDLSLENFMLTQDLEIRLGDFAQACHANSVLTITGSIGKKSYGAYEIFARDTVYNPKTCDMWSLGICIFAMFFNCLLWFSHRDSRFIGFIHNQGQFWEKLEEAIKQVKGEQQDVITFKILKLVKRLVVLNPDERMTIKELKQEMMTMIIK